MATIKDSLKAGIETYSGRKVNDIKLFADPVVAGTYAIRATFKDRTRNDFLVIGSHMEKPIAKSSPDEVAEYLEEIECETWPPAVGEMKFFV